MSNSGSILEEILSLKETRAYRRFRVNSIPRSQDVILDCCQRLAEHSFDEIKINAKHREMLARLFAQAWLIKKVGYQLICRFCLPLSLLLDESYEFDFDQQRIFMDLFSCEADDIEYPKLSTHPFCYNERLSIFPELSKLGRLSLPTKFTFALLVLESDYNRGFFVPGNSRIDFKLFSDDFGVLEREGLLVTKPTPAELLCSLDSEDLKQFAEKMKVRSFKRRNDLIQEIISKVPPNEIQMFVQAHLEMESPVLPTMTHLPLLRKFMLVESNRFDIYLEWLAFKLCKIPSTITPLRGNRTRPSGTYLNAEHNESKYLTERPKPDFLGRHKAEHIHALQGFWDSKCDEIIGQSISIDSTEEIVNYFYFLDVVKELKKLFGNFEWKYILRDFIASKYLDKYHPTAAMIDCPGCEHRFREYSVGWSYVELVKGNVQFCDACYEKIFGHENYANSSDMAKQSNSKMLDCLRQLFNNLERIPTQTFMGGFPLRLPSHPTSKQIAVGKTLLTMPAMKLYATRFGSWLKCLDLAGILEGGYIQRVRGIQVFAKDGHLCLSLAEKVVDDWLSTHGVSHEKEPHYPFHTELNPNRLLRADWKVKDILIEYAGLMDDYEYALKMKRKKSLADSLDLEVIVLNERNLDELNRKLGKLLKAH